MTEPSLASTAAQTSSQRRSPYVGPRPFRATEPFFGREHEARNLVNTLLSGRIVLLHSPSGAGKTSLIQAAVVPAFKDDRGFGICAAASRHGLSALRVNLPPPPDVDVPNRYVFSVVNGMVGHLVERHEALDMRIRDACDLFERNAEDAAGRARSESSWCSTSSRRC